MLFWGAFLWVSVPVLLVALFGVLNGLRLRCSGVRDLVEKNSKSRTFHIGDSKDEIFKETESSRLVFKFEYQTKTPPDFTRVHEEAVDDVSFGSVPATATNKYEFNSGTAFSCFLERPEEGQQVAAQGFLFEDDFTSRISTETAGSEDDACKEAEAEQNKSLFNGEETCHHRFQFVSEGDFFVLVSDSAGHAFLSDKDFEQVKESDRADIEWEKQKLVGKDLEFSQRLMAHHSNRKPGNEGNQCSTDSTQQVTAPNTENPDLTRQETWWEHQDLIEQLKGELKKARGTSLPTILEDSEEYPKIMEDLKPLQMDDKCRHEDRMSELHKLYKSYSERMRKLDILSYQKMYPLAGTGLSREGLLLKSISVNKSSSPSATTSLISQSFRQTKQKISEADEMVRYVRDLQSGLETVYVGQLCLSWEMLQWQYERALEVWESDHYQTKRYNEVAGEFQQFQVLLQRFLENEPFEGPRVQSYANNRRSGRNLLQVPLIREDSLKVKGRNAISSDMLVEIMEESIRMFWRFVRADRAANVAAQKSRKGAQLQLLDGADAELATRVRKSLQKMDKRLKEASRGGNCILRKMRMNGEDQESSDHQVLCFFSQVDVKLVARVLGMSRVTRDQLLWCHSKLSSIRFVNGKLHVDPSFLLFPCG